MFDVANDTVNPAKLKIVFYSDMQEAPLRNIDTIEKYAEIAEKYWGYDVYPNTLFPNLAPMFPILYIREYKSSLGKKFNRLFIEGEIGTFFFLENQTNFRRIKMNEEKYLQPFKLSFDFLFNSSYSAKVLPKEFLEVFKRFSIDQKNTHGNFHIDLDPGALEASFANFGIINGSQQHFNENYSQVAKTVTQVRKKMDKPLLSFSI